MDSPSLYSQREKGGEPPLSPALPILEENKNEEASRLLFQLDALIGPRRGEVLALQWIALPLVKKASEGRMNRFHDLRHFYASMLIAQGENPKHIQDQLGHASIRTTFDIYGHLMPQARREAAAKLAKFLFEEKPTEKSIVRTVLEQETEIRASETVN